MARLHAYRRQAFSLIEVVLAIAVCSFAIIAILGLFASGLRSSRDSQQAIQAADLASNIISTRSASPANTITGLPNLVLTAAALASLNGSAAGQYVGYVGTDGQTSTAAAAAYRITCQSGTTTATGTLVSQVYMQLTWPPQATTATAAGSYEIVTDIPLR